MAIEEVYADAILVQTNLSGTLSIIQDDPDSPNGQWMTAIDEAADTVLRVSMGPVTGGELSGTQTVRILCRKSATGGSTPSAVLELYESGTLRGTIIASTPVTDTVGVILSGTFDPTVLTDISGAGVEIRFFGDAPGGKPADRRSLGIAAIEWTANTAVPISDGNATGGYAYAGSAEGAQPALGSGSATGTYAFAGAASGSMPIASDWSAPVAITMPGLRDGTATGGYAFEAGGTAVGGIFSDDFEDGVLDARWIEADPGGIATWTESGGLLSVTTTAAGDAYQAPAANSRMLQTHDDTDFDIAVKWSIPAGNNEGVGLWMDDGTDNEYLRWDLRNSNGNAFTFVADRVGTTYTIYDNANLSNWASKFPNGYVWLRLKRVDTTVTCYYRGVDGGAWTLQDTLACAVNANRVGLHLVAGAAGGESAYEFVNLAPTGGSGSGAEGKRTPKASATGEVTHAGSAAGARVSTASALGAYSVVGTSVGQRTPEASATGDYSLGGTAVGKVPPNTGTATPGAVDLAGAATGKRVAGGAATGTTQHSGTAVGDRPPDIPIFVGSTDQGANAGSLVVTYPPNMRDGDLAVLQVAVNNNSGMSTPAGFTLDGVGTHSSSEVFIFSREVLATDSSTTFTINVNFADYTVAILSAYRNVVELGQIVFNTTNGVLLTGTYDLPVHTLSQNAAVAITLSTAASLDPSTSATPPAGYTLRDQRLVTNQFFAVADIISVQSAGTQVSGTWSHDGASNACTSAVIELIPIPISGEGSAAGSHEWVGSASGARAPEASAGGGYALDGSTVGATPQFGDAVGGYELAGLATGARTPEAAADGGYVFTGSAVASVQPLGVATGGYQHAGTAQGVQPPNSGEMTGGYAYAGGATGERQPAASAEGGYLFAVITATGDVPPNFGGATGAYAYSGTAVGGRISEGAAAGQLAYDGSAVGDVPANTGDSTGVYTYDGVATGERASTATADGGYEFTGVATGDVPPNDGLASGAYSLAGVAGGERTPEASATGGYRFSVITATGDVPPNFGSADGDYAFTGAVTAAGERTGEATGGYELSGTAAGDVPPNTGDASSSWSYAGTGVGKSARVGAATPGTYELTGSATGEVPANVGAAVGELAYDGAAEGEAARSGDAVGGYDYIALVSSGTTKQGIAGGAWNFAGTSQGATTHVGAADGGYELTGSATGAQIGAGAAVGAASWSGSATGVRESVASAAGELAYTGSASGNVPANSGAAAGSYAYAGASSGKRVAGGAAAGVATYAGTAEGRRLAQGTGTLAVQWTGDTSGKSAPGGAAVGSYAYTGSAPGLSVGPSQYRDITLTGVVRTGYTATARAATPVASTSVRTSAAVRGPGRTAAARPGYTATSRT